MDNEKVFNTDEYGPDIVSVVDEEGVEHTFEELDRIETDEGKFVALLPVYDEAASVKDFLDNGYLKVTLTGAFAETYIAISKDTAKQIEAAQKRQARITEKAVAIKTAKALEAEEKKKTE